MTSVHQFVPTLEPGAVGAHVLEIRRILDDMGVASETFTEHLRGSMVGHGRDFRDYGRAVPARPGDVLVFHVAIGSPVADFVAAQPGRLVLDHHNITPPSFWAGWEPAVVPAAAWARRQLADLGPRAELGIAHSRYSERELHDVGCHHTAVVPVLIDLAGYDRAVDEAALERLAHPTGAVWLFVGRVAPNKAHHDIIKAFAVHRRVYDPHAVLRLVGGSSSDRYVEALRQLITALGLDGAVELTGSVSDGELAAHYRAADVFVCLSDHEGFCVPLLEAMHHGLPIVAYDATAVGETLGSAGIALPGKSPAVVAAAVQRVLTDDPLRAGLVAAGRTRLAELDLATTAARYRAQLEGLLG
ncbi:MAG: hypothetical protein JWO68_3787 [Actinomycetia bacterium]|nr:hypothetical protein [Actinomycetes bacterium]